MNLWWFKCIHRTTNRVRNRRIKQRGATMIECLNTLLALKVDPRGLVAVEYALIAGLLAVAVLTASGILGSSLDNAFSHVADLL
jgi:Flp pilus assembly pilin Flp